MCCVVGHLHLKLTNWRLLPSQLMLQQKEEAARPRIIWSQVTASGSSSLRHLNKKTVVNCADASIPIYCAVPTDACLHFQCTQFRPDQKTRRDFWNCVVGITAAYPLVQFWARIPAAGLPDSFLLFISSSSILPKTKLSATPVTAAQFFTHWPAQYWAQRRVCFYASGFEWKASFIKVEICNMRYM